MYKQVLQLRYGISNCCPEEDEQYIIQKELIDLAALNDPAYPCSTNSCGCSNDCDCSTTQPVCPVIPITYDCFCIIGKLGTLCECIEIGDGSGEYSSFALCKAACVPTKPVTSYNCTNGSCVLVSGPSGTYPTLTACQANCQPITSYNCTNGNCVLVSGSSGQYPTLAACEENCTPLPIISYNCIDNTCVDPGDGTGEYSTLLACEEDCGIVPIVSYDCFDGSCVDPGDGSGNYPTLVDCENSFIIVNQCIDQGIIDSGVVGFLGDQFDWMSINHPSSLTYSYYFEMTFCVPSPTLCVGPNGGCLQRLSSLEIVDNLNIVVLFTAYQIDDLIIYLNTNYPTCTPAFFAGQSYIDISSQFERCTSDLTIQLGGAPCVCNLECANIE
jgi:hypothetical protein